MNVTQKIGFIKVQHHQIRWPLCICHPSHNGVHFVCHAHRMIVGNNVRIGHIIVVVIKLASGPHHGSCTTAVQFVGRLYKEQTKKTYDNRIKYIKNQTTQPTHIGVIQSRSWNICRPYCNVSFNFRSYTELDNTPCTPACRPVARLK